MDIKFIVISMLLMIADGFTVRGPAGPLVAPLGSSVVLPCYVDKALSSEGLEVEWKRTDSDTLVHLFLEGESRPESQQEDYHDRAHFFTDQITRGNFSLRLDKLRAEDEGKYTCKVYSGQDSGETVVQIKDVERLLVSGSVSANDGKDVTLNCSVDSHITPEHFEEVSWKKIDEDDILVLLYENNKTLPDSSDEQYRDRVEFFTDEIPKGNFSLRLKSVRTEDKGVYMCQVFAGGLSANATVVLERVEYLLVSGSNRPISAYDGEDITLNCSVDSHIKPEHIEEVKWIRTGEDILVLLYENNEPLPDSSDEQYRDRVEFFTDEIPKGNFSLRLKSVRSEDKGVYMCQVFAGGLSANATVVLEQLGFSSWHITVLVFCFVSGSGAVLLLCRLIYCRSKNTVSRSTIWNLQVSLVFFPNICMSFAFFFWGLTEGFLHETVTCCALYILRPVMLIWALPLLKYLQDNIKTWIRFFKITREFAVFTVIVYSVLFTYGWRKSAHDTNNDRRVGSGLGFGLLVVSCLLLSAVDLRSPSQQQPRVSSRRIRTLVFFRCILAVSLFQLFQMILSIGLPYPAFFIVIIVQPLLLLFIQHLPFLQSKFKFLCRRWITLLWIITITLLDIILVIYIHLTILEREKEYMEWTCVIVFLEVLKMIVFYENNLTEHSRVQRQQQTETSQQGSNTFLLCHEIMYMFGAVGLVLLNSVTLTAELILKARNGERVLKDLRVIVFPSECVFALYWLVLKMHAFYLHPIKGTQIKDSHQLRNILETLM